MPALVKVLLFGASGMVGQGVLRECLLDPEVTTVLSVGRSPTGTFSPKLTEILWKDLTNLAPIEERLRGYDAAFFCLGISVIGMTEEQYPKGHVRPHALGGADPLKTQSEPHLRLYLRGRHR